MPELRELCARAVEAAEGNEQVEAYAEETQRTQIRASRGEVEQFSFAESRGVGVRLLVDGRQGYAYSADPGLEEVGALVARARESARFAEPDEANLLPALIEPEPLPDLFRPSQLEVSRDRKVDVTLDLERVAVSTQPEVRKVEVAIYGDSTSRLALASSLGGPLEYARTDCWVTVSALAERGEETQSGFAFRVGRDLGEVAWRDAATEAADRAARLLGGTKPKTERVPVLLDPVAGTAFLGVLATALSAEAVHKGRSPLAGLVGSAVASEAVTLVDDGRLLEGPNAAPFDDEGVATGRTTVVEGGALRGFLHNTRSATREGTRSTGNASRGGYRTTPGISSTNLLLVPGETSAEELFRQAGRAVYVQDVTGLHSGANPVSGQFSVGATGLRVEGGAFDGALREMTIASTLLDVLKAIVGVGSDLRFMGQGIGAPTVLVGEMTVAGV
jgi:PmbA protein